MKITPEMIREWLGNALKDPEEMAILLADIANGTYNPMQINQDICDTLELDFKS